MKAKTSVFISYAHKDGMEFTRRLAFALGLYMDVFWDRRLQAGEFPRQLEEEIEKRDFLLFVMTPHSIASDWCKREVEHAEKCGKRIVLARVFSGEGTVDPMRSSKYIYGDFSEDFEIGFRGITALMLGNSYSSWEVYSQVGDEKKLLELLEVGYTPGLIAKEIVEWVIVEKLWAYVSQYVVKAGLLFSVESPRTAIGVLRTSKMLTDQFAEASDALGVYLAQEIMQLIEPIINEMVLVRDDEHAKAGNLAYKLIMSIKSALMANAAGERNATGLALIQGFYDFDVTEKLRELITLHARRSRYLY